MINKSFLLILLTNFYSCAKTTNPIEIALEAGAEAASAQDAFNQAQRALMGLVALARYYEQPPLSEAFLTASRVVTQAAIDCQQYFNAAREAAIFARDQADQAMNIATKSIYSREAQITLIGECYAKARTASLYASHAGRNAAYCASIPADAAALANALSCSTDPIERVQGEALYVAYAPVVAAAQERSQELLARIRLDSAALGLELAPRDEDEMMDATTAQPETVLARRMRSFCTPSA